MPQVRIQKPKAILFDINGTTANNSFCDRYLGLYIRKNVRGFLSVFWDHEQIQRDVRMMRNEVAEIPDQLSPVAPEGSEKNVIIDSVVKIVADSLDKEIDLLSLAQLRFVLIFIFQVFLVMLQLFHAGSTCGLTEIKKRSSELIFILMWQFK